MNKSAMIIINPTAGKENAASYKEKIKEVLKTKYSHLVIKDTKGEGDAKKFAREACEDKFDLLIALGGDGTVNEIVNGLAGFEKPPMLGIVPLGTVNNLAGALDIPDEAEEAIELFKKEDYKRIDLGLANDRYFTNTLGIGKAATSIYNVKVEEKTKFGPLAYIMAIGKEIFKDEVFQVRLEMEEKTWEGEASVILVGLLDSMGGLKSILPDAEIGDGKVHIFAIKNLNLSKLIEMTPSLIAKTISESKNIEYFQTKKLKISTSDNSQYGSTIDGDEGPKLPLYIKVLPRHLKVISREE